MSSECARSFPHSFPRAAGERFFPLARRRLFAGERFLSRGTGRCFPLISHGERESALPSFRAGNGALLFLHSSRATRKPRARRLSSMASSTPSPAAETVW